MDRKTNLPAARRGYFPGLVLGRRRAAKVKDRSCPLLRRLVNEGEQIVFCHVTYVQENVLFPQEDDSGKL